MVERVKNKKGFTIIEIMVVVALIGILASVLVPQFGGVKDTARNAGMLTNAKMVEVYVASIIDNYPNGTAIGDEGATDDMKAAIEGYFTSNPLTDPYTGTAGTAEDLNIVVDAGEGYYAEESPTPGTIYVVLNDTNTAAYINGFDVEGKEIKNTQRTIVR
ncbi:MAG TPA: type II secretion system protein [Clostridia bacterium]|nr:type II secretion system protein [Clostridia bacterium]